MKNECGNSAGRVTGLAHIGVYVMDMEKMLCFFRDTLGFAVTERVQLGQTELAFLDLGSCPIELVYNPRNAARPAGIVEHICLEVEGIDALTERLRGQGVKFLQDEVGDMPGILGGVRNIFLEGPEGLKLEFFEYYKK